MKIRRTETRPTAAAAATRQPPNQRPAERSNGTTAPARMTCVFEVDGRSFKTNPLHADTPFGKPVVISIGDLAAECDRLRDALGAAYQIVGALAHYTNTLDNADVQRALDFFSSDTFAAKILPWPRREIRTVEGCKSGMEGPKPEPHRNADDAKVDPT